MPRRQINLSKWDDYRGKAEAVLVYMNTSSQTELPVRDILNEFKKGIQTDPNYETGTYNFLDCSNSKLCASAINNRRAYLLFSTLYQGTAQDFQGKYLIIGYMKISKTMDARKRHMHQWMEAGETGTAPVCVDLKACQSFYADEMNFYRPADCFVLTEEVMKAWGYKGRVAKHMKLTFSEENTSQVLSHFSGKTPANDEYCQAVAQLETKKEEFLAERERVSAAEEDLW